MLRLWASRLALIPLAIYALGVPIELESHRFITLFADGYLPFEIVFLAFCIALVLQGQMIKRI